MKAEIHTPGTLHVQGFLARTPLLPTSAFSAFGADLQSQAATEPDVLAASIERDRLELRRRMGVWLGDPVVRESLYFAAPGLLAALPAWRAAPDSKAGRDVERSLVRYFARMSTRCTPFGLFSGLSVGTFGATCRARLGDDLRRRVTLDAELVFAIAEAVGREPQIRARVRLFPNTTIVRVGDSFRYVEIRGTGDERRHELASVPWTRALERVLESAAVGAIPADLAKAIVEVEPDVDMEEAVTYLAELEANDLLCSELRVELTGRPPLSALIDTLRPSAPAAADTLAEIERELHDLDCTPLGVEVQVYDDMRRRLDGLCARPPRHAFHAQMHRPTECLELEHDVLRRVVDTADTLRMVFDIPEPMGEFRGKFVARYGEANWRSLAEVLDEEAGIGFGSTGVDPSSLLQGIPLRPRVAADPEGGATLRVVPAVARIWAQALETHAHEITLTRAELMRWEGVRTRPNHSARQAFSVIFSLGRRAHDERPEIVFRGAHGPSGVANLGRFAHAHPEVDRLVREHIAVEEADSDAIFAEIVHLPSNRLANVVARPLLRDYEIPCGGRSGAAQDRQIALDDLEVAVVRDSVELRSRRLGRRVVPRLASAHNSTLSAVTAYRFLSALQRHRASMAAGWSWGGLERMASFLPRVRIDDVVVAKAQWNLGVEQLRDLRAAQAPADRFAAVRRLRALLGLPRFMQHGYGDVQLLVDLENTLSIDAFVHEIGQAATPISLRECYPEPDREFVQGSGGGHCAEFCVPVVRVLDRDPTRTRTCGRQPSPPRTFGPGSEWLFLKAYGGNAACEDSLTDWFAPALRDLGASGVIDRWFFIRYSDPDWHLRLRVHGEPGALARTAQARLLAVVDELRAAGLIWKVEIGEYERETRRYGGPAAIELIEAIFHADSVACTDLLRLTRRDAELRWHATLLGMDRLLAAIGMNLAQRLEAVAEIGAGYLRMLDPSGQARDRFSTRYRARRGAIERTLAGGLPQPVLDALDARDAAMTDTVARLRQREVDGLLDEPLADIAQSLLHMFANRMFRSTANAQECVIYEFLRRAYRSAQARRLAAPQTARGSAQKDRSQ